MEEDRYKKMAEQIELLSVDETLFLSLERLISSLSNESEGSCEKSSWIETKKLQRKLMVDKVSDFLEAASTSHYKDDDLNPLKSVWKLCFEELPKTNIRATNEVTNTWKSQGRDRNNLDTQKNAVERLGIGNVERVFIVDTQTLAADVYWDLHNLIRGQLLAGLQVYITSPHQAINASSGDFKSLDFIIFDNETVYFTDVNKSEDTQSRRSTKVTISEDKTDLKKAIETWIEIQRHSLELTQENLDELLKPGQHV